MHVWIWAVNCLNIDFSTSAWLNCVCVWRGRFVVQTSFNRDWFEDVHDVELYACYNMHPMKSPEKFMDLHVFPVVNAQRYCKADKLV